MTDDRQATLTLVRVHDLVGRDVSGKLADVRCRDSRGDLIHADVYKLYSTQWPGLLPLQRVRISKDDGTWLRLEWDGRAAGKYYGCGFSGLKLTGKYCNAASRECARNWFILVDLSSEVSQ